GMGEFLIVHYPLAPGVVSGIGFHRRRDQPPFGDRERTIAHTVFQQLDWLHRHGTNTTASERALQLSPRARQVLVFLLGFDSVEEVAARMELSRHTVDTYVKGIYRRLEVSSRGELLALFLSGGRATG